MGYAKAREQLQSSARPRCPYHAMTSTGCEPATIRIAASELVMLRTVPQKMQRVFFFMFYQTQNLDVCNSRNILLQQRHWTRFT